MSYSYLFILYNHLKGESNGTPLQYSRLENPMDGRAWWAAVHGVVKSWTLSLFTFMIGEGNGNPLQWSCLENPRDRGACWAGVYGVAQSRTRLMWLRKKKSLENSFLEIRLYYCKHYLLFHYYIIFTSWDKLDFFPTKLSMIQVYLIFCFSQMPFSR